MVIIPLSHMQQFTKFHNSGYLFIKTARLNIGQGKNLQNEINPPKQTSATIVLMDHLIRGIKNPLSNVRIFIHFTIMMTI